MKKIILAGIVVVICSLNLMACASKEESVDDSVQTQGNVETQEKVDEESIEEKESVILETYYDANEAINLFLNNYNTANPDTLIKEGMFEVYHHHGQTHENQIIMYRDSFEIVMSDNFEFEIVIDGESGEVEAYKELFKQYAKGYDLELTDETLDAYWTQVLEDLINCVEFEEFECDLTIYNDQIEYMKLSGNFE